VSVLIRSLGTVLCVAALVWAAPIALASDGDSDKIEDEFDNCVGANPFQFDADRDGEGDLCERPILIVDEFAGTEGPDLVFGGFRSSVLSGGEGTDSLYGEGGDDTLDGGPGLDALAGGPGNDRLTGGAECDVFGIETRIEQRDVITDFSPIVDRVRFPPLARGEGRYRLPSVEAGGADHLVVSFIVDDEPVSEVEFLGLSPTAPVVLSTDPCGPLPIPAGICPRPRARRSMVFVGFVDASCPDTSGLRRSTGVFDTDRYTASTTKLVGPLVEE
jgi:hypothetical protein